MNSAAASKEEWFFAHPWENKVQPSCKPKGYEARTVMKVSGLPKRIISRIETADVVSEDRVTWKVHTFALRVIEQMDIWNSG